jgi:CRP/FNR family transcriptional regulator, cyclic AMP receptor protein
MSDRDMESLRRQGRDYPKDTVLFREGDPGAEMYVIHTGAVQLTRGKGAKETVLAVLPAGEFFGEMAIVINRPRTATATVVEDARLLVLDATTFETMVRNNAEIALRIIKKLAHRLEAANQQIDILLRKEPNHRVVFALRVQAELTGRPEGPGVKVDCDLDVLAQRVGLTIDEVKEVLERLARARLVSPVENGFIIPQVGRLQEYLEFLEMREQFGVE